ncbi:MAG: leucine--tRNA ligase [bacterium]
MKNKTYILGMFPYPSGEGLHVGHVRIFTACDVMARYFRMKNNTEAQNSESAYPLGCSAALGFPTSHNNVMSPMGWDAFGLPAENAAIKAGRMPQEMVPHNYANFRRQMQDLSLDFDWEREFATADPQYYAITQWIFLQLYKKGLVYREEVPINWCPKCKTGLANEEVLADGTHERCGTATGKKLLPQWVMKITSYAERLLSDLDLDLHIEGKKIHPERKGLDWPTGILEMQRNWIGKKEGIRLHHKVEGIDLQLDAFSAYPIWCFADTFMVIAPEHPMVAKLVAGTKFEVPVKQFIKEWSEISEQQKLEDKFEKKGVFTGRYTDDPFNPREKLPVWVANFAMMGFGTGIIRCSAHDPRDYEFAKKYQIPLKEVVERTDPAVPVNAHTNEGVLKDSGPFTGKKIMPENIEEVKDWIEKKKIGKRETTYHLRDWVFSRQRYWGEPIPLVYCDKCGDENGVVPLTDKDLPLELPTLESYEPTDTGESPLSRVHEWVNIKCPKCGGPARRETDTMPNWAGSCWYFLAYPFWAAKRSGEKISNLNDAKKYIKEWCPVDWYLGGAEHAVLHLLYARFWVKVLQDLKIIDFPEPFLRLRSVGMVLAEDGKKMSKSLGNVVNPDDMVAKYGSDAVRMYEMFMGPWEQSIAWDSGAISGQVRFLGRIRETVKMKGKVGEVTTPVLAAKLKALVERVERGVLEQKFNTAIAGLMEFVNSWREEAMKLSQEHLQMFAGLLSLFAPKTAKEISKIGDVVWPDVSGIEGVGEVMVTIAVQVNGKLRATIDMSSEKAQTESEVVKIVSADERVKKWVTGEVKKTIFVPGKLVNLVV